MVKIFTQGAVSIQKKYTTVLELKMGTVAIRFYLIRTLQLNRIRALHSLDYPTDHWIQHTTYINNLSLSSF